MATGVNDKGDRVRIKVGRSESHGGIVVSPTVNNVEGEAFSVDTGLERGSILKVSLNFYLLSFSALSLSLSPPLSLPLSLSLSPFKVNVFILSKSVGSSDLSWRAVVVRDDSSVNFISSNG